MKNYEFAVLRTRCGCSRVLKIALGVRSIDVSLRTVAQILGEGGAEALTASTFIERRRFDRSDQTDKEDRPIFEEAGQ